MHSSGFFEIFRISFKFTFFPYLPTSFFWIENADSLLVEYIFPPQDRQNMEIYFHEIILCVFEYKVHVEFINRSLIF